MDHDDSNILAEGMECELEFWTAIGSEQLDVWRCKAHRYNFFHKRNEEPTACPVARGEVPGHPCAPPPL